MSFRTYAFRANIALIAVTVASTVQAAPVVASAAYGVKVDLSVAGRGAAALAATGTTSGTAGASYARSASAAKVEQSAKLVDGLTLDAFETLKTGLIGTSASGGLSPLTGEAAARVDGLSLAFTTKLLTAVPLISLGLTADTITSATHVGLGAGGLVSSGSSRLEGLKISGGLLGALKIDGALLVDAAPNTEIKLAGLSIIVNEQKEVRSAVGDISRYTNAIRVSLTDYLLAGSLVTGNIVIGHSEASIRGYVPPAPPAAPVPEPATWAMLVIGFALAGAAVRRRRPAFA